MTAGTGAPARFSVVVPAHDEEAVVARCLRFVAQLEPGEAEVVVVANGCSDATARVAGEVPGVRVVELAEASKSAALNAGDGAVTAFPRVYLDADIAVEGPVLRRLAELMSDGPAAVGAPRAVYVTAGRPRAVRLFYDAYVRLPYAREAMVGTGVYALNAAGRARFEAFPPLTADDLFVQRCFGREEVRVLEDGTFEVQVPRSLRSLVAVRTRVAYGSAQLAATGGRGTGRSTGGTVRALVRLLAENPRLLPAGVVYLAVTVVGRASARRRAAARWQRDESSRSTGEGMGSAPRVLHGDDAR